MEFSNSNNLLHSPRTKTCVLAFTEATRLEAVHSHAPWWSLVRGCRSREPLGSIEYDVRRTKSTYQEHRDHPHMKQNCQNLSKHTVELGWTKK